MVRRLALPPSPVTRLGAGCVGFGLLLAPEVTVVLWLRGLIIDEYLAGRDPIAGTVYVMTLAVFALMPLLVPRGAR